MFFLVPWVMGSINFSPFQSSAHYPSHFSLSIVTPAKNKTQNIIHLRIIKRRFWRIFFKETWRKLLFLWKFLQPILGYNPNFVYVLIMSNYHCLHLSQEKHLLFTKKKKMLRARRKFKAIKFIVFIHWFPLPF